MASALVRLPLEDNYLFKGFDLKDLKLISKELKKQEIANDFVSVNDYVGVIISGIIEVFTISADGAKVKLSKLSAGDIYGISNLYYEAEWETILKCRTNCEIVFVEKQSLKQMLSKTPDMMERYAVLCNQKINFLLKRANTLTMQTGKAKLSKYLLSLERNEETVKLTESKESLAKTLGMSRAALFRELSTLKDEGIIEIDRSIIKILDEDALEDAIHN